MRLGYLALAFFLILSIFFSTVQAQESVPSGDAERIDVYGMFWPVVSGTTVSDSMFWAKQLKENLIGFFKFGDVARAEYKTEIAEKRFVESYKLFEDQDYADAFKSLELNKKARDEALNLKKKAVEEKQETAELVKQLVGSLEKQEKALAFLQTKLPEDQKERLTEISKDLTLQISEAK